MINPDQLDQLCVITYKLVQGNVNSLTEEELDLIDEIAIHAEDVMYSQRESNDEPSESGYTDIWDEDDGLPYDYDNDLTSIED
jgi:hypothetical protein